MDEKIGLTGFSLKLRGKEAYDDEEQCSKEDDAKAEQEEEIIVRLGLLICQQCL